MGERLDVAWRVFATGLCFTVFGIGGVTIGLVALPLTALFGRERRVRTARALVRTSFLSFVLMMRATGVLTWEIHGRERLARRGLIVLANHPSLIDVVLLGSLVENACCVVKAALTRNPFTVGPVTAAGYVFNDSGPGLIDDCIDALERGDNLLIFPEGTRSERGGPLKLLRGAANVAVRARRSVTPVTIECEPPTLAKGERWYQVPKRRVHFRIVVRPDVALAEFLVDGQSEPLAARRLTDYLQEFFTRETRIEELA